MKKKLLRLNRRYALAGRRHVRTLKRTATKPFFTVPAITFLVLLICVVAGVLLTSGGRPQLLPSDDTNIVMINYDKQDRTVPTKAKSVGGLLKRLHIKLGQGDVVEPDIATPIIGDNFRVNVYRAVPVTIVDGGSKRFAYSAAATPRSIVKQSGITVYPEDRLELLPTDNFVTEGSIGERVVINRATPVAMNLYGTPVAVRTHAKNVKQLLKEKNINLGKDDSVEPALASKITATSQVFIIRKGTKLATEEQVIPMPKQTVEDKSLSFGSIAIRQQGAPGKKLVTYQIDLVNGLETGRRIIQEVVAQEAVPQIEAHGATFNPSADKAAVMAAAGIKSSDYAYADYIVSRESGWCHTKWQGEYGTCRPYHGTPTSSKTGYGLCQATPASKMASSGADWGSNPVTQLKWCHGYAIGRYGSWSAAYKHWIAYNWW